MKFKITYFYMLRFLKPNQIPISTALWDPKWYNRDGKVYVNDKGVIFGLKCPPLSPQECTPGCCPCNNKTPGKCKFIQEYMESLRKLNFLEIKQGLENMAKEVQGFMGFTEDPEIILVVYETPNNPCSERGSLIQWFLENNVNLEEYERDDSN